MDRYLPQFANVRSKSTEPTAIPSGRAVGKPTSDGSGTRWTGIRARTKPVDALYRQEGLPWGLDSLAGED